MIPGKAYLVGAGPGRADLITVRGLNLIRRAEVILYDRLIAPELLQEARPDAHMIFVGKGPDCHAVRQEEINRLLVTHVRAGRQVVRLKGGDPFVFGRGGEELLALVEAGLPFEVVPGISSALAAPLYAGIPVTHRTISTAFTVVTGHEDPTKPERMTDWAALAHAPTLILLMAVGHINEICRGLIIAGRAPETPAIAISAATTAQQRTARATLATLPVVMAEEQVSAPAVIVIGEVVALNERLVWFEPEGHKPPFFPLKTEL
jgi:uroporphyrin-III C-methyltransferase